MTFVLHICREMLMKAFITPDLRFGAAYSHVNPGAKEMQELISIASDNESGF